MMREILFRGKRQYTGKWAESVCPLGVMCAGHLCDDFDPATVGQFTGLTDKNGKRIFEGDIVRHGKYLYDVRYYTPFAMWVLNSISRSCMIVGMHASFTESEVIGNIHDNPELLEGGGER